jgi:hypothetical protein
MFGWTTFGSHLDGYGARLQVRCHLRLTRAHRFVIFGQSFVTKCLAPMSARIARRERRPPSAAFAAASFNALNAGRSIIRLGLVGVILIVACSRRVVPGVLQRLLTFCRQLIHMAFETGRDAAAAWLHAGAELLVIAATRLPQAALRIGAA